MKFAASKPFQKDIKAIRDKKILARLAEVIEEVSKADRLENVTHILALAGHTMTYRIRIGDYRIGCFLHEDTLIMARILHRKEIYRYFP